MPKAKKLPPQPEVTPEVKAPVAPAVTPVEALVASPVVAPNKDPRIEYIGEGADQVQFVINPKAVAIRVYSDGSVLETL